MDEENESLLTNDNDKYQSSKKEVKKPLLADLKQQKSNGYFVYILTFFAAVGGFLFGYDTGVVSGALILLTKHFQLSFLMEELVVSITIGAAIIGAFIAGPISHYIGRKIVLIISSIVFTFGALCMGFANTTEILLVGRAIVGIGIGLASMAVPVYVAEAAPAYLRGKLVTLNNLFITGGQFVASVVDGIFCYDKENGWRYMLGLSGVPAIIMFFGLLFMPESPRWLVAKGHVDKARKVLKKIRNLPNVDEEIADISEAISQANLVHQHSDENILRRVWNTPAVRCAVFVGCGLQAFQQLTGINTVMYYSSTIIKMAGTNSDEEAIWLAVPVAFTNFLFTLVGVLVVERMGRRKLLLISITGVIFSLLLLSIAFFFEMQFSPEVSLHPANMSAYGCTTKYDRCSACIDNKHCGFCYVERHGEVLNSSCLPVISAFNTGHSMYGRCNNNTHELFSWNYDHCPFSLSWLAVLGLIMYLAWFAPGMGPMPWTVNSEIYPQWARSFGNTSSATTNWVCNLLVSMTFLHLTRWLTKCGAFSLYTCIAFVGWLFIYHFVPETKGKTLEEVTKLFDKREKLTPLCVTG